MTGRLAILLMSAALAATGCGGRGGQPDGIILITLDTTRADRLGCYGNSDGLTPNLDALAGDGAVYLQAQAPVPVASHEPSL